MKLTQTTLEKSMSKYLKQDFRQDEFHISMLEINDDNKACLAHVDIISHAKSTNGTFHLSALTNSRIIQQIGIILSCHFMQTEKDREIYFLSDAWKYKRSVSKLNNIQFSFININLRRGKEQTIARCQIDVEEGSFLGNVTWLIPNRPYEISK